MLSVCVCVSVCVVDVPSVFEEQGKGMEEGARKKKRGDHIYTPWREIWCICRGK